MNPILALDGVAALRGDRLLFDGLSMSLDPGNAVLVVGANGAGKSTLLRIIAGLLPPSAGRIARNGSIAYDVDAAALDPELPLARAMAFWARLDGRDQHDVARGLDAMGIGGLAEVPVRILSTGQRRRAALARTIISRAAIWLLDEPGNGLDTIALERLLTAVATHRATGGVVVAATHQQLSLGDATTIRLGGR